MKTQNRSWHNIYVCLVFAVVFLICLKTYYHHPDFIVQLKESTCLWTGVGIDIDYVEKNLQSLDQQDPQLIKYTRIRHMTPPSNLPYNLKSKVSTQKQFSEWVANFFKNMSGGIFLEAGANDGEDWSHTLYLERNFGWTGILIECNPKVVPSLKSHHRKAWVSDACLAPTSTPGILNFTNPTNWSYSGTFNNPSKLQVASQWEIFEVATMPLYTIIASLGWKEIDYFNFDIEGIELKVLKTFPFDLVIFKVLIVEIYFYNAKELEELNTLLQSNDYIFVKKIDIDNIYIHKSVKHLLD